VSVNLLTFPGFSDCEEEVEALIGFIRRTKIDMLQLKNLNIDPKVYFNGNFLKEARPMGMLNMLEVIKHKFPGLKISYFNIPKEEF